MSVFSRGERLWVVILGIAALLMLGGRTFIAKHDPASRVLWNLPSAHAAAFDVPSDKADIHHAVPRSSDGPVTGQTGLSADDINIDNSDGHADDQRQAESDATILDARIDINIADEKDLLSLPGIGPVLAARIVSYRLQHGAFRRVEDLLSVKGIGPTRLETLRAHVQVSEAASD